MEKITTKKQYEEVKKRLIVGEKKLEGHWEDTRYAKWVKQYGDLMESMLEYEYNNKIDWAANL